MTLVEQQPTSIKIGTTDVKKVTVWRGSTRLPSAYQEVEYIQSSGTQYFIVGTSFKTSYKSVIDLEMVVTGGDYIPLGVHNDAGKRYGIDVYGGKFTVISGGGSWTNTATEDTNRHLITIDKTTATVDGTSYSISYVDYTYNKGICVFGYYNTQTNGVNYKSSNKLYKLDIYDENGTQIYDLVPCYRKSDSVIGMYDIVTNTFYTNQGTGTFTKGNDVGGLQEIQVRPTTSPGWKPGANTIAYYPLNGNMNDYSGNNRNLTVTTGSMSYGNLTDGQYGIFNGSTMLSTSDIVPLNSGTMLIWAFFGNVSDGNLLSNCKGTASSNYANYGAIDGNNKIFFPYTEGSWGTSNRLEVLQTGIVPTNAWVLHAVINDGTTLSYYKNGSYITGKTSTMFLNMTDATLWCIGGLKYGSKYLSKLQGGMSNIIIENKVWSAQEIADYFDQTKANYGIGRLPSEYQEVEYIQSTGTQYFIVGSSFRTDYKSVIDFQMTQTGGDQVIIGFNLTPYRYGINAYANNFKVITGSIDAWSNTISENTNRHTIIIDKSTATVDGNNYIISGYTNATVNGGIGVFAHNDKGVGNYFARVKMYKLDIYDENGVHIYDLVPCYRKSDGEIGMYDIVTNTFYANQGTGTFTKGGDV